jgi:hypothetical protein
MLIYIKNMVGKKCKQKGGCNSCGLSGGCSCGTKGGGNLEDISVPFLLLLAKHGMDTIFKSPKKGGMPSSNSKFVRGGSGKKKTIKDVRRRVV